MRRHFDLTPLGHPLWWGALALLLVNDVLLKGRGVVPGWLTGKLSDFAFLIVAPVLFAALLPRRIPGRRTLAIAAVVGLYVAADLSRAVSDAVVAAAARLGLAWRLWPDPTDLLALAVLPATIWLLRRSPAPAPDGAAARRARVRRERAGIVLGAIACIATSAPPSYAQHPFLHNRTADSVAVQITWVLSKVDCSTTPEALAATLSPSDLDDPRPMTLQSGDVAALDGAPPPGTSPVGLCTTGAPARNPYQSECVAAILQTDGAEPVLMVTPKGWLLMADGAFVCPSPPPVSECAPHLDPGKRLGKDTLGLSDRNGTRRFEVSRTGRTEEGPVDSNIQIAPVDPAAIAARPPAADGCRATRDAYRAFLQSSSACASAADCTTLPAAAIQGETASCVVYVNKSASAATAQTLGAQWASMCAEAGEGCQPPLAPLCKAGVCADPCAGVALPVCPPSCSVDYHNASPRAACTSTTFACTDSAGRRCACDGEGFVACAPPAPVAPDCPYACQPPLTYRGSLPAPIVDAGVPDAGGAANATGDAARPDGASADARDAGGDATPG